MRSSAKDSITSGNQPATKYEFQHTSNAQEATKAEVIVADYQGNTNFAGIPEDRRLQAKLGTPGSIALSFLIGASWVSLIGTLDTTLSAGIGCALLLWGMVIVTPCSLMSVMSLAECSSLWPVGNMEVWTYNLATPRWKRFSAYQSGWALAVGYIFLGLSTNAVIGQLILAMVQITNPSYTIEKWHTSLVMMAISVVNTFLGIFGSKLFEKVNNVNFFLNIATFLVIFLVLLIETGKQHDFNTAYKAFIYIPNASGFKSAVIPWMSSLSSVAYATCAFDAPFHFASEMRFPERSAPISAIAGLGLNCLFAIIMALALIFCSPPESETLINTASGSAFTQLMINRTGSVAGVTVIIISIVLPYWVGGVDGNMACARIMWGLANRGGLPKVFGVVNHKWDAPWFSLIIVTMIQGGLGFINIGSDAAFSAFINVPLLAMGISYIWVSFWMLFNGRPNLKLNPSFKLGPIFGPMCNIMSIVFALCELVFLCLPSTYPVTAQNVNYTCVILVFFIGLGPVFWFFYGRQHYRGPIPEHDDDSPSFSGETSMIDHGSSNDEEKRSAACCLQSC